MPMGTAGEPGVSLRRLRVLAGHSLRELAELAGVSHGVIARAERGYPVSVATRDAVVKVLGPRARKTMVVTKSSRPSRPPRPTKAGINAVVAARHKLGLSRREAAKRFGIGDRTLARIEAGRPVHPANAKRVALALGLDMATVVDLANEDNEDGEAA